MTNERAQPEKLKFNKTAIEALPSPESGRAVYWDATMQGYGVRVMASGTKTFFVQARIKRELVRVTLGRYPALTAEAARKAAKKALGDMAANKDPRPERQDKDASTLGEMMQGYVQLLEAEGKISSRPVEKAIQRNIEQQHPRLWKKPAASITQDDCMKIIERIAEDDKPRQADKLRSYLKTAFSKAITSKGKINAPMALRRAAVTANPCLYIEKLEGSNKPKTRALSISEFRAYWRHAQALPEPSRSLAMLHVITGGQRQQQLARVKLADLDRDGMTMLIWDNKGRRKHPRAHYVPLLPDTLELIDNIAGTGEYVFSCNGGLSPIHIAYLNDVTKEIEARMAKDGELEGGHFTAGTIRATIETRLMKKPYSVTSDVLAYLLSHGMGTVQRRHYQHDEFLEEKTEALEKLWRLVNDIPEPGYPLAQVVQMGARA